MTWLSKDLIEIVSKNTISSSLILLSAIVIKAVVVSVFKQFLANFLKNARARNVLNSSKSSAEELNQRSNTIMSLFSSAAGIIVFGIAFIMILSTWGVNVTPILTGAGILGLAVGFGTQTLVHDIVTGFFILLENQYNVGDKVNIAGKEGYVKEMRIRTTVLEDESGNIFIIPNSQVQTVVRNKNDQKLN